MKRLILTFLAALTVAAAAPLAVRADDYGHDHDRDRREDHPAYLHALSDLRAARWMIKHRRGDWAVAREEDDAWRDVEKAIGEIKHAAIDDGKDIDDHPSVDEHDDHAGRLHKALDLLRKTRDDLSSAEENGRARGLRKRAFRHIDHAIDHLRSAIHDAERDHDHERRHHDHD